MIILFLLIACGLIAVNKIRSDRAFEFTKIANMSNALRFHDKQEKNNTVNDFYLQHPNWRSLSMKEKKTIIDNRIKSIKDERGENN